MCLFHFSSCFEQPSVHHQENQLYQYILTYLLTPWSRVVFEKLTGSAASQEIPLIFGTRRFLTVPTSARHLSLSWANSMQSPQLPPTSWRSILILSSHLRLGLPNGLFPSGFPIRTLCTPLPSPIRTTCPAHLILLDFTTRTIVKLTLHYLIFLYIIWVIISRGVKWVSLMICVEKKRNAYRVLVGKLKVRKRPPGRPSHRWEDSIKLNFKEIAWEGIDWTNLALDRDCSVVRTVMNLSVQLKVGNFLRFWATISDLRGVIL